MTYGNVWRSRLFHECSHKYTSLRSRIHEPEVLYRVYIRMCARIRECARGNASSRKYAGFAGSRIRVFVPLSRFHDVWRVCVARCACSRIHEFANSKKKIKKKVRELREHSRIRFVFCSYNSIHELFSRPFASLFTNLCSRIHDDLVHPFAGIHEALYPFASYTKYHSHHNGDGGLREYLSRECEGSLSAHKSRTFAFRGATRTQRDGGVNSSRIV